MGSNQTVKPIFGLRSSSPICLDTQTSIGFPGPILPKRPSIRGKRPYRAHQLSIFTSQRINCLLRIRHRHDSCPLSRSKSLGEKPSRCRQLPGEGNLQKFIISKQQRVETVVQVGT
ncbi:hypothetical protein CGRA01v4_03591 [Colletotrichum graminicola]|nr:hypothetical protein CGRA01v4_03591 [Colletotrichum graminicola]